MADMRMRKKGFILIAVMMFLIAALAATVGLYMSTSSNYNITAVKESERIKGYYATVAGLRYSMILLKDPANLNIPNQGDSVTRSIRNDYPGLYSDLELKSPHDITITITNRGDTSYDATSVYNF